MFVNSFDQKSFRGLLSSETCQRSIGSFVGMSGLSVKCIGTDGVILGKSYEERNLCKLIRSSDKGLASCRTHCGKRISHSIKQGEPAVFTCHAGLLCFSTPLKVRDHIMGVVFGGKILTDTPVLSKYAKIAEEYGLSRDAMFQALGELRVGKIKEIRNAMDYLNTLGEAVCNQYTQSHQLGQRFSKLFTLFHLGNDLNLAMDNHELYGLIINSLTILFDLRGCFLMLMDPSQRQFLPQSCYGPEEWELSSFQADPDIGIIRQMLEEHRPVHTEDRFQIEKSGFNESIESVYLFPIHFAQKIGGCVCIVNSRLTEETLRMIQTFCDQAALAIQNLELRKKLQSRVLDITNIGMLSSEVEEVREINELFELILKRSTEIVKAEQASLMILDEATQELTIKACKGMPENILKNIRVSPEGVAGKVIREGKPLLVEDIEKDSRTRQKKRMRYRTKSFVSIPLVLNDRSIGVINISDKVTGEIFNQDDLKVLKIFASQAVIALERTQLYERSKEMEQVLITDHLTGLLNRRYFFERTTEEIARAQRHSHPLSLMMIDVDDFKWYNDQNGHLAGDDALRNVTAVIRDTVRNIDFVARYGGEEFTVVLPQTFKEEAMIIGERLRKEVESFYFPYEENQPLGNFTISIGLATYPEDARNLKGLIDAADKALYGAKDIGKNQLRIYRTSGEYSENTE